MSRRPKPIDPGAPPVRPRGPQRVSDSGNDAKSFAEMEREHARQIEQQQSSKRKREPKGISVAGSTRTERPASRRSGSRSNASRRTRGH
jgi:hypothetical protein